ncbi:hypothetical protein TCELL_0860 [Thermogladius calderae 1633]|uniref:Uncharacterized protein n=1 Tax=Thermogladius calderae (strain DSM 22663 / VKM B-2946 / 1633) TaxID=1184251 RepID=I3TEU6_THEC1|nr:hypothetical protein [Thermogladius calderae]AFK51284.1 hypothetical protein TCELL_0860 [Thermogladius calderae 1633]
MGNLLEKARENPWQLALECRAGGCDIVEAGRALRHLLLNDTSRGLELLRALKSNLDPFIFLELLSNAVDPELLDWVEASVRSEVIVDSLRQGRLNDVYGYVSLLELMPFLGMGEEAAGITSDLLKKACELSNADETRAAELVRLVANGPMTTLGLDRVAQVISAVEPEGCHVCCLEVIVEMLNSIVLSYPPKSVFAHRTLLTRVGELLNKVLDTALKTVESDKEAPTRVFRGVSAFLSQLRSLASDSKSHEEFSAMRSSVIERLGELGEKLGLDRELGSLDRAL